MEQLYGESPEIHIEESYNTNGGIALYSTQEEGTITGGSGTSGSQPSSSRIYWTITRTSDPSQPDGYAYSGGITGVSWFKDIPQSPFANPDYDTPSEIWNAASPDGNLNEVFDAWNEDISDAGTEKRAYFMYYISVHAKGCSSNITS